MFLTPAYPPIEDLKTEAEIAFNLPVLCIYFPEPLKGKLVLAKKWKKVSDKHVLVVLNETGSEQEIEFKKWTVSKIEESDEIINEFKDNNIPEDKFLHTYKTITNKIDSNTINIALKVSINDHRDLVESYLTENITKMSFNCFQCFKHVDHTVGENVFISVLSHLLRCSSNHI